MSLCVDDVTVNLIVRVLPPGVALANTPFTFYNCSARTTYVLFIVFRIIFNIRASRRSQWIQITSKVNRSTIKRLPTLIAFCREMFHLDLSFLVCLLLAMMVYRRVESELLRYICVDDVTVNHLGRSFLVCPQDFRNLTGSIVYACSEVSLL